jgi:hypothetical protein
MIAFFDSTHKMLPGVGVSVRSVAVTTRDGVVVINPIDFTAQQRAEIRAMGNVVAVVEANRFHSSYASAAKAWFPRSDLWGAPGLPEKCPEVGWNKILHQDTWPYAKDLETIFIRGAGKISESVFYHPATKTLIVTDLVFNLRNTIGLLAPITYRLVGIHNRFTASRFWPKLTDDTNMVRDSLNEILRLDFDRLVMAHGKILTKDAKSKLAEALKARGLI